MTIDFKYVKQYYLYKKNSYSKYNVNKYLRELQANKKYLRIFKLYSKDKNNIDLINAVKRCMLRSKHNKRIKIDKELLLTMLLNKSSNTEKQLQLF